MFSAWLRLMYDSRVQWRAEVKRNKGRSRHQCALVNAWTKHLKVCLLDKTFKRQARAITSSYLICFLMRLKTSEVASCETTAKLPSWDLIRFMFTQPLELSPASFRCAEHEKTFKVERNSLDSFITSHVSSMTEVRGWNIFSDARISIHISFMFCALIFCTACCEPLYET